MKKNEINTPDFIQIPGQVFGDKNLKPLDMVIYGLIYQHVRLGGKKCFAGDTIFSSILGISSKSFNASLVKLEEHGYVELLSKEKDGFFNVEIIPLVIFGLE